MSCNCNNNLSEKTTPPTGAKAVWEEYKIPICLGGAAIVFVFYIFHIKFVILFEEARNSFREISHFFREISHFL